MRRNRGARLQRQAEISDDFDKFLSISKGSSLQPKLATISSRVPNYGGSLPSFHLENNSPSPVDPPDINDMVPLLLTSKEDDKIRLSVPSSPMIQRSHSSGECCSPYSSGAVTPRTPSKMSPSKFFNNVKSLLESCDKKVSCVSPPSSPPAVLEIPKCPTAPHSRSNSLKRKKMKEAVKKETGMKQQLTTSMPAINKRGLHHSKRPSQLGLSPFHLQPSYSGDTEDWERVRNFVTSPKKIINCGDSFRRSNSSLRSLGSWGSGSHGSEDYGLIAQETVPLHRVVILGGPGVGKTTLAQQFVTSECLVNVESVGEFEDCITVSVLLNEEEARVDLMEIPYNHDYKHILGVDAYIIVYASIDRSSFHHAVDLLYQLCKEDVVQKPVILVANKSDLVRAREIAEQEGKSAAVTYNCKYFEVSSLMNLKVDELLAGILNQIRLHGNSGLAGRKHIIPRTPEPILWSHIPLMGKLFNRQRGLLRRQGSKSCDNLLVI